MDAAISVLEALRSTGKTIGIISHVERLQAILRCAGECDAGRGWAEQGRCERGVSWLLERGFAHAPTARIRA